MKNNKILHSVITIYIIRKANLKKLVNIFKHICLGSFKNVHQTTKLNSMY